jgi:hypothetical protein
MGAPQPQSVAILLSRLPRIENAPGLILLRVDATGGAAPPTTIGSLTDAALRGRLAHFDQHSANELAAVRHALAKDSGEATVYEHWFGVESCLQFWHGFTGSRIRIVALTCDGCGKTSRQNIGGTVGETLSFLCTCGRPARTTVPKTVDA